MRKFLIAGVAIAAAAPLLAQVTPVAPVAPAVRVAPMADKVLSRTEVQAKIQTHFTKLDVNRDGFVTTEEMGAMRSMRMAHREGAQGKTGRPMREPAAAFDRIDANKDGMISRDEFAKGREMRIENRVVRQGANPGQPGAMRMRMHRMGGGMFGGAMLKMADANNDGRVSLQEATSGALRHFDMADTNRDGRITPEERRAGRTMMREMRMRSAG